MFREFGKLVYGPDSPYARTPEFATLANVGRDDLVAYHKKYFAPNRVILGLVGDFDSAEMAKKVKEVFGPWPKGSEVKDSAAAYRTTAAPGVYYAEKDDMNQSDIMIGHLGIQKNNPDVFAVDVMNEAWGGGFASRLFSNVRSKKGLAYAVNGGVGSNYDYPGTFTAWMTTKTETTGAGIDALMVEIEDLAKNPLSQDEVQRAKDSILNSFIFNYDSRSKILRQQITYAYFGFPADYLARYRQNIEKVTVADVERVAKKYVHKDQLAILVVGPSKGQDRPLDSFGKVTKLDLTIPMPKGAPDPHASAPGAGSAH
jgi:zinc protease